MPNVDQAAGLRRDRRPARGLDHRQGICCFAIASGKGGVGKTFISTGLAVAVARLGKKVLLVDADLGLANADIVLGAEPRFTLQDAIFRGRSLEEVVTRSVHGVDLLAASSGSSEMVGLGEARINMVIDDMLRLAANYDVLLFDCASGINASVLSFLQVAPQTVIVATGQPTAIMDVYALVKVIHQRQLSENLAVVVNMAQSDRQGRQVFDILDRTTRRFLRREMALLGIIPESRRVSQSLARRQPLAAAFPEDPVTERLDELARGLLRRGSARTPISELDGAGMVSGIMQVAGKEEG